MVAKTDNNIVRSTFLAIKKSRNRQRDPSKTWPCLASILLQRGKAGHPWCRPPSAGRTTERRVYCCPRLNEFDHSFCWICKKKKIGKRRESFTFPKLLFFSSPTTFVPSQTRCRGRVPFSANHWFRKCQFLSFFQWSSNIMIILIYVGTLRRFNIILYYYCSPCLLIKV